MKHTLSTSKTSEELSNSTNSQSHGLRKYAQTSAKALLTALALHTAIGCTDTPKSTTQNSDTVTTNVKESYTETKNDLNQELSYEDYLDKKRDERIKRWEKVKFGKWITSTDPLKKKELELKNKLYEKEDMLMEFEFEQWRESRDLIQKNKNDLVKDNIHQWWIDISDMRNEIFYADNLVEKIEDDIEKTHIELLQFQQQKLAQLMPDLEKQAIEVPTEEIMDTLEQEIENFKDHVAYIVCERDDEIRAFQYQLMTEMNKYILKQLWNKEDVDQKQIENILTKMDNMRQKAKDAFLKIKPLYINDLQQLSRELETLEQKLKQQINQEYNRFNTNK